MPITLVRFPEPLSDAALHGAEPLVIESAARQLLVDELRRYCAGEVAGRSFLIAGHRGIGKTTLVRSAVDMLLRECSREEASAPLGRTPGAYAPLSLLRPLFIPLHGPTVLGEYDDFPDADGSPPADGATTQPVAGARLLTRPRERILVQITLGLHRALATELTRAYRNAVRWSIDRQRLAQRDRRPWQGDPDARDRFEIAAQLEIELAECPPPSRLRELWLRGGFLDSGVLYPQRYALLRGAAGRHWPMDRPPAMDQGLRELVALSTATAMYQRLAGKLVATQASEDRQSIENERTVTLSAPVRELLSATLALVTGGTAAVLAAKDDATPGGTVGAAVVGLVAALGAAAVLRISSTRKRTRSISRRYDFEPDLKVATLDRQLPALIERVRAAGLAPVFVVDELDKVDGIETRFPDLAGSLKQLLTENAFFCCLTDRSYFEFLQRQIAAGGFQKAHTAFSHRVLVTPTPPDFHRFLGRVLRVPADGEEPGTRTMPAAEPEKTEAANARADATVLPYVLLHRSRMHTYDLDRRLASLCDAGSVLRLVPPEVRGPTYGTDVVLQVAVECWLEHRALVTRLARTPELRQTAQDALYYPSGCWRAGRPADLSAGDGADAFRAYLEQQALSATPARRLTAEPSEGGSGAPGASDAAPGAVAGNGQPALADAARHEVLDRAACEELLQLVRSMAHALTKDLEGFEREVARWTRRSFDTLHPNVRDALAANLPVLVADPHREHAFTWRVATDPSDRGDDAAAVGGAPPAPGVPPEPVLTVPAAPVMVTGAARPAPESLAPTPATPALDPEPWEADRQFVDGFILALSQITWHSRVDLETLATSYGIVGSSPSLAAYRSARDRLQEPTAEPWSPSRASDMECVEQFAALVRRSAVAIVDALVIASFIGKVISRVNQPIQQQKQFQWVIAGLDALTQAFQFLDNDTRWVAARLQSLRGELAGRPGVGWLSLNGWIEPPMTVAGVRTWAAFTTARIEEAEKAAAAFRGIPLDALWERWRQRFTDVFRDGLSQAEPLVLDDVLSIALEMRHTRVLHQDVFRMSLGQWGRLLSDVLRQPRTYPAWLAPVALYALGFSDVQRTLLLERLRVAVKQVAPSAASGSATLGAEPAAQASAQAAMIDPTLSTDPTAGWPPRPDGQGFVVLVRTSDDSIAERWPAHGGLHSLLPLDIDIAGALLGQELPAPRPPAPPTTFLVVPRAVVFELPASARDMERVVERARRAISRAVVPFDVRFVALHVGVPTPAAEVPSALDPLFISPDDGPGVLDRL
ncbi:hypothetical protein [Roseisolibacter agri]|uniref:Uncharacterized protein n=1 Tax=Roseisolibacter agri TaxID=2014610 RepID=A0AA37Q9S4_9BACT|nr:hypothetical protein [Roseisolibacter agri]GLC25711.1 hypothetical protein rosag_22240 [Roseisolibacter agri]